MAENRCGAPLSSGGECRYHKLPGFPNCLKHLEDEYLDAAEKMGYRRCKGIVAVEQNPRYGKRCMLAPLDGEDYCDYHRKDRGSWLVAKNQKQRGIVRRIHKVAESEGIDTSRVANPLQALLEVADEAVLLKEALKQRVLALKEDEWRYEGVAGEQIRGEILLYERALDRVARLLVQLTRLGIEERLARVTERQGYLINKALEAALEESGVALVDQDRIRESVARHLRAVE